MSEHKTLEEITNEDLHISYSAVSCYRNCSLKFLYKYVEGKKPESLSINLILGSSIHTAINMLCCSHKNAQIEPFQAITDTFQTSLTLDINNTEVPVIFSKTISDVNSAISMGNSMLKVFYDNFNFTEEVVAVDLPLSAILYDENKQPTEYKLVGVIDLLIKNNIGELIVVDFKTASKSMSQEAVHQDQQLTSYSYILAANKYIDPKADIDCRFDVLLKTKEPKLQQIKTIRTKEDRKRFAKIASAVLSGISNRVFYPVQSFLCSSCEYSNACKDW
ncbi:MAG: PD-(D/E)XK nuclease family protein [Desulfamplus sp.]|nr:PD-(D/E)XK nuclease family protein [Desulfamplus sp.]